MNESSIAEIVEEKKQELESVLNPVERLKQSPDTRNLTVGQMRDRDEDNLKLVIDQSREYLYSNPQQATMAIIAFLMKALLKFQINAIFMMRSSVAQSVRNFMTLPELITYLCKDEFVKQDIRLEARPVDRYAPEDQWKSGLFIYHGNEISYWISNVMKRPEAKNRIIITGTPRWFIKTNVPN